MFYRVDWMLAVQLAGFLAARLFGGRTAGVAASRLARRYYAAVAIVVVLRVGFSLSAMMVTDHQSFWNVAGGFMGDLLSFLFGALFGLAARRHHSREFLVEPAVLAALCLGLAFTFALAGIGKAFNMSAMTEFFTQSGYPVVFLKFIVIAEIFGAVGLLLPWALPGALIGLSIDMLGAAVTHVHNGDPLNDSTGAIALLIRMAALGVLWALRPREGTVPPRPFRTAIAGVALAMLACLFVAVGGSVAVRDLSAAAPR